MSKHSHVSRVRRISVLFYQVASHPYTFIFIILTIIGWFIAGYFFSFDDAWYKKFHLFEITIALLMVFTIESTQHADNRAMQEKLDEIIRKMPHTDTSKVGLEKKYKGE